MKLRAPFYDLISEIDDTFGTYTDYGVDRYPTSMRYKFSDNPWFSDSFPGDQKCH